MIQCLEFQFDTVIGDRTMILHNMFLLSVVLRSHEILTWEFFLNRFDALCLEAQLGLESTGDISSLHGNSGNPFSLESPSTFSSCFSPVIQSFYVLITS